MKVKALGNIKHDGTLYTKGDELEVSNAQAKVLVEGGSAKKAGSSTGNDQSDDVPTMNSTREELDAFALEAGITDPEGLPNKQDVLEAIQEKQGSEESEA